MKQKNFDFELVKELDLVIANEYEDYKQEQALAENYIKKWKKGMFNFEKAKKGVLNLIVTPRARKYQKEFGINIGKQEREAVATARLRALMVQIKEKVG